MEQRCVMAKLPLLVIIAWLVVAGMVGYKAEKVDNDKMAQHSTRSFNLSQKNCVGAQPSPTRQWFPACQPYIKGNQGYCSNILGQRHVYGSTYIQDIKEENLAHFLMAKAYILENIQFIFSEKCQRVVDVIYCNHYFRECDNTSATILPRPVCREACEAMVQQHCKEEWPKALAINKRLVATKITSNIRTFDLINCSTLPRMNGGEIPECNYPKQLREVQRSREEDLGESCFYGAGQSYRGNVSVTRSGYTCQSWTSQCPHRHHRTPNDFPELINAGNACRNPGGQGPLGPWCYTTNRTKRWEYCDISSCTPVDARLSRWSPYTSCSVTCGGGNQTRNRTCNPPRFGGKPCSSLGALVDQRPCNELECPVTLEEKAPKGKPPKVTTGLTWIEITIVSAGGTFILVLIGILVTFIIRHKRRDPDVQEEEEISPYASVHISTLLARNTDQRPLSFLGMIDNPLKSMHMPQAPTAEKLLDEGKLERSKSLSEQRYENLDQQGRPIVNPLEHLFYKPRYENEEVEHGIVCDVLVIKPGYDILKPNKRREKMASYRRTPSGSVDSHGLPVYDTLVRREEIPSWDERRPNDTDDSESDDDRLIHTILEVPSADERSQASSIERTQNADRKLSQSSLDSESKEAISIVDNDFIFLKDWKTETPEEGIDAEGRDVKLKHPPRSKDVFQMEDQTGLFGYFIGDSPREDPIGTDSESGEVVI